jgi:hypothetical protein
VNENDSKSTRRTMRHEKEKQAKVYPSGAAKAPRSGKLNHGFIVTKSVDAVQRCV